MAVSSTSTETYNLVDVLKGDTFNGVIFTVNINAAPKDLTATVITCDFKYKNRTTGPVSLSLSLGSGLTIVNAVNGVFQIDPFLAAMEVGIHYYDIQFDDAGIIKTYIEGELRVFQDIT